MADVPVYYPVAVLAFVAATAAIGVLAVKLVKKSSKRYIVAGKSLPLFFVGTMLVAEAVDGNTSLGADWSILWQEIQPYEYDHTCRFLL